VFWTPDRHKSHRLSHEGASPRRDAHIRRSRSRELARLFTIDSGDCRTKYRP
jgi:hypothetical protein